MWPSGTKVQRIKPRSANRISKFQFMNIYTVEKSYPRSQPYACIHCNNDNCFVVFIAEVDNNPTGLIYTNSRGVRIINSLPGFTSCGFKEIEDLPPEEKELEHESSNNNSTTSR